MITSHEFSLKTPEIFRSLPVVYGETRRDPDGDDPLSGNTSQSPSLGKVYDWLSPAPLAAKDQWIDNEQRRAQLRLELLYRTLANRSLVDIALTTPEHGLTLIDVDATPHTLAYDFTGKRTVGDATLTRKSGKALLFNPADCPIINLASYSNGQVEAISQIHAGAKGITDGIVGISLRALATHGLKPASMVAYIGPHSKQYTLYGQPLETAEQIGLSSYLYPTKQPGHRRFDMAAAVTDQLTEAGVGIAQIETANVDTSTSPHYYSQRVQSSKATVSQKENPYIPPFARNGVMFAKKE